MSPILFSSPPLPSPRSPSSPPFSLPLSPLSPLSFPLPSEYCVMSELFPGPAVSCRVELLFPFILTLILLYSGPLSSLCIALYFLVSDHKKVFYSSYIISSVHNSLSPFPLRLVLCYIFVFLYPLCHVFCVWRSLANPDSRMKVR